MKIHILLDDKNDADMGLVWWYTVHFWPMCGLIASV
jgi:hypothetical protein